MTKLVPGMLYTFYGGTELSNGEIQDDVFVTSYDLDTMLKIPSNSVLMFIEYRKSTNARNADGDANKPCSCEECTGQNIFLRGEQKIAVYSAEERLKRIGVKNGKRYKA